MKQYFIDSNVLLRVIVRDSEKSFRECFDFLQKVEGGKINAVTSNVVLAEVVWVLDSFYKMSKTKIVEALEKMRSSRFFKLVDNFDFDLALSFYSRYGIKYVDAIMASNHNIQSKKWTVVSYDKDFDKLGVIRKEPSQIV
jgi:predicted nucleic acid-binding protein